MRRIYIIPYTQCLLVALLLASGLSHASSFDEGLDAYLKRDYAKAQSVWRQNALTQKDGRSMFNLGLLHEQRRILGASEDKAKEWFRKSAQSGYLAANYHLALKLLKDNDQDDEALLLIQKASDQGYMPAQRYLERRGDLVKQSLRSEEWILRQKPQRWTIQLLAFNEFAKVKDFVNEHDLHSSAAFFREPSRDVLFYKLIYGDYSSKDAAHQAREALPAKLRQHGPWLRKLSDVQAAVRAGTR